MNTINSKMMSQNLPQMPVNLSQSYNGFNINPAPIKQGVSYQALVNMLMNIINQMQQQGNSQQNHLPINDPNGWHHGANYGSDRILVGQNNPRSPITSPYIADNHPLPVAPPIERKEATMIVDTGGATINGSYFTNNELSHLYSKFKATDIMDGRPATTDLALTNWGYQGSSSVLNEFYNWVGEIKDDRGYEGIGQNNTIAGTDQADRLTGTEKSDYLLGKGGNDTISGHSGNDYIDGGKGNDIIYAGAGDDNIVLNGGNNQVYAGLGKDSIVIKANEGFQLIDGNDGNDRVSFPDSLKNYHIVRQGPTSLIVTHNETQAQTTLENIEVFRFRGQIMFGGVDSVMKSVEMLRNNPALRDNPFFG